MRNTFAKWKKIDKFFRAFLIFALCFFALGLGTIGSTRSTGKAYELCVRGESDEQQPAVVFKLDNLTEPGASGETVTVHLRVMGVYVNIANIYGEAGTPAVLRVERRTASGSYNDPRDATFENFFTPEPEEGEAAPSVAKEPYFDFVQQFTFPENGWRVSTYPYVRLTALTTGANVLINEVVFYGEKLDSSSNGTGEFAVVPAEIAEATPYANESAQQAIDRAAALLDAQRLPTVSSSSFHHFTDDEIYPLMSIAEMEQRGRYATNEHGAAVDSYRIDRTGGVLGLDLLALGTKIFGMSPFGLRFFPMLFSFIALVAFSRFAARLFRSERAGLAFAVLYACSNVGFALGHLGASYMIAIGFFALCLDLVHRFYAGGMKKGFAGGLPLLIGGLCGAAAIATNGVFVIPVFGVVVLFVLGMFRQQKAKAYYLAKAAEDPEPVYEPAGNALEASAAGNAAEVEPAAKRVARVAAEYRLKNTVAPAFFGAGLLLGTFLLSLIAMLPAYFVYLKAYAGPASGTANLSLLISLGWKAFAACFTGSNAYISGGSPWLFYTLFTGEGGWYAVTGIVPNVAVLAAGAIGFALAVWRLVGSIRVKDRRSVRKDIRRAVIPLVLVLLSVVAAVSVKSPMAFIALAQFALILFAAGAADVPAKERKHSGAVLAAEIVVLALAVGVFLACAAFTFSVPLPASFMDALVK